ncbi:MAG: lipopolysaccharide biosynthesis protein RfbH [Curvibacter lanceolatus]|jgi:CDP-6-deoxy-D-xylo-4-hexulose-3-dehydrase|uniref:lipopolysaccharide biosynthesis protein RfbH n=1 Tax=Curvibacter lanceolatus TaxID=86182 RepID=UPI00037B95C7|nr:lipopolysaccharide biosynthesis protein RfbH [Curvibacter lanceolatus]MBV5293159.1 lipopolysaccharide biosynthesis protein RfbH [Curvibacter lanceolatus]
MSLTRHQLTAAADGQVHLNLPELAGQELEIIVRPARAAATAPAWRAGIDAIPPSGKVVGDPEKNAMIDAALDAWLTTGRFNDAFEKRLADFVGVKHALTVNSGSSANLVAFSTLTSPRLGIRAIRPGDEVITVAAGFPTTVNPIIQNGAVPVFVDAVLPTYNIDVSQLEAALSPRTKAIMIAHTLGNPFDLDAVCAFAQAHGLWLVEDCCDALGSTWKGRKVGTFGHLATLSFYPAHHITMGEGGAVLTSDPELRQIAESFRDWGRDCWCKPGCDNTCGKRFNWQLGSLPAGYDHKYTYSHLGYNLKITDMQAACGLAQLDRLEGFVQARKDNFAYLSEQLKDCADLLVLPEATPGSDPSWFGFPITLRPEAGLNRQYLLQYLDEHRIGTRLLFAGNLIHQPYMQDRNFRVVGSLKAADQIMNDTFWIGVWPGLSRAQLDYMVSQLRQVLGLNF